MSLPACSYGHPSVWQACMCECDGTRLKIVRFFYTSLAVFLIFYVCASLFSCLYVLLFSLFYLPVHVFFPGSSVSSYYHYFNWFFVVLWFYVCLCLSAFPLRTFVSLSLLLNIPLSVLSLILSVSACLLAFVSVCICMCQFFCFLVSLCQTVCLCSCQCVNFSCVSWLFLSIRLSVPVYSSHSASLPPSCFFQFTQFSKLCLSLSSWHFRFSDSYLSSGSLSLPYFFLLSFSIPFSHFPPFVPQFTPRSHSLILYVLLYFYWELYFSDFLLS